MKTRIMLLQLLLTFVVTSVALIVWGFLSTERLAVSAQSSHPFIVPSSGILPEPDKDEVCRYGYFHCEDPKGDDDHWGIDIWTQTSGEGLTQDSCKNLTKGNPVYAAYEGTIIGLRDVYSRPPSHEKFDGVIAMVIIEHHIDESYRNVVPELHVWTLYTHMGSHTCDESFVDSNLIDRVSCGDTHVEKGDLLGYQGNRIMAGGDAITHLHFQINTVPTPESCQDFADPTPYIGVDCTVCPQIFPPSCPPEDCTPGRDVGRDFFVEVLERLANVPVSDFAVDALVAWEPYEDTSACWNPLATTWKMNVVCYFNCLQRDEAGNCILGVQHYQNQDMGVQATANTLNQGYYDAIRRMLRSETFDREGLRAALRTWGTCSGQSCDSLLKNWEDLWNEHSGNDSIVISSDSFKVLQPGQTGEITFDVQNTGSGTWRPGSDYALINTNGVNLGASPIQTLTTEVPPGRIARWVIPITAPSQAGVNWTEWQMAYNEELFGAMMAGLIIVAPEGEIDFDLLALLEEWVNELEEQISAELKEFWEDLERRFTEWLQRELERQWREFWESLCGASAMVPAALSLGAWSISRRQRGRTKHHNDRS
jgi:hypothetical protein